MGSLSRSHAHCSHQETRYVERAEQLGIHVFPGRPKYAALGNSDVSQIKVPVVDFAQSRFVPLSTGVAKILFPNLLSRHEKTVKDAVLGRLSRVIDCED